MPAWHDGTGPKGPADRGATKAKARGLFLPTSGFATYLEEPVHNMNESQKARQMGIRGKRAVDCIPTGSISSFQ